MEYLTLDIEFVGEPHDGDLLAVGVKSSDEETAWVFPEDAIPGWVEAALEDEDVAKVVFTKTDHRWLKLRGFRIGGPVIDVQVMAWAVNELTDLDLDSCYTRYVGGVMDKRIRRVGGKLLFRTDAGTEVPLAEAPWADLSAYCARDVKATEELMLKLLSDLNYDSLGRYWREECVPLSAVLVEMETRGIPVDVEAARAMREELEQEMADLEERLTIGAGLPESFNIGSNDQVGLYLYEREFELPGAVAITKDERAALKAGEPVSLPPGFEVDKVGVKYARGAYRLEGLGLAKQRYTETGKPATDAKTLAVYYGDSPWVEDLLAYKKRATVVQTFLRTFEERAHAGRIYGRFNQTGTKTGRLSSNGPNLQNIPARGDLGYRVRSLFRAENGMVFVHGDYSQLEPRLMAHFSGDPLLLRIFREGQDIYLETARAVFPGVEDVASRRSLMKTYVLAMGYGAGASKLQELLAIAGFRVPLREVEETLARLKSVYATYFAWREATIAEAAEERFIVTLAGHRRRMARPTPGASWKELGHDERAMANAKVQGSAADIVARTMVRTSLELPDLALLAQVHDELLWEAPLSARLTLLVPKVREIAETGHGFELQVPLVFEPRVVTTWAEGKD